MKNIMLIGDSIRQGYHGKVIELLTDKANVTGPEDNCRFSAYTFFNLYAWILEDNYDVIHWNNGQWDTCYMSDGKIHTSLDNYLQYQERIATALLKKTKRLIFATTTPVWPEMFDTERDLRRNNKDINEYNTAATNLLTKMGVEINDLNALVAQDVKRYISEDMVHLTEEGYDLCATCVANKVQ